LWASIDQLGDYLAAHLHPEQTPLHQAIELALQPRQPTRSPPGQACLGWMRRETGHSRVHWHNGSTYGFGSFVALDRQHDAAVGALINRQRPPGLDAAAMSVLRHMASRPAGA
jgi:serine-type D-Ala-D-Ala carboxypeptidase/endopeptidase